MPIPIIVKPRSRKIAIQKAPEFQKKHLATHALDVGILCGHQCRYCSSPAVMRLHPCFTAMKQSSTKAFMAGVAIPDPDTPIRIPASARSLAAADTVIFCPKTDAWSEEARQFNLGRRCLEALLTSNPACRVRILTKNAEVVNDLPFLQTYRNRISISLSLTAPSSKEHLANVLEPNASSITDRVNALQVASKMGFQVYGMICPCIPGLISSQADLNAILDDLLPLGPDTIWVEPVNPRGSGLKLTEEGLRIAGHILEANQVSRIRDRKVHDVFALDLINLTEQVFQARGVYGRLKVLMYNKIQTTAGNRPHVIWL